MPDELSITLDIFNIMLTVLFTAEMLLKMFALSIKVYFQDGMNYIDFISVFTSILELFISFGNLSGNENKKLRMLRSIRAFRVARLFRYIQSMETIVKVIGKSISKFIYLALLLLLFIIMFSLLGMEIF